MVKTEGRRRRERIRDRGREQERGGKRQRESEKEGGRGSEREGDYSGASEKGVTSSLQVPASHCLPHPMQTPLCYEREPGSASRLGGGTAAAASLQEGME